MRNNKYDSIYQLMKNIDLNDKEFSQSVVKDQSYIKKHNNY